MAWDHWDELVAGIRERLPNRLAAIRYVRMKNRSFHTARTMVDEVAADAPWYRRQGRRRNRRK